MKDYVLDLILASKGIGPKVNYWQHDAFSLLIFDGDEDRQGKSFWIWKNMVHSDIRYQVAEEEDIGFRILSETFASLEEASDFCRMHARK